MGRGIWSFLAGVLFGALAVAGTAFFLALQLAEGGFTVHVPAEQISDVVSRQVEEQVRASLPGVLDQARAELPDQVKAEVAKSFDGIALRIGEVNINLPPSTTRELQNRLQLTVERAVGQALDELDVDSLAAEMAEQSESLIAASLRNDLNGHKFLIQPYSWLTIPITVQVN